MSTPLPSVTDGVEWPVGLSVTIMSPAKPAELIKICLGRWALGTTY